MFILSMEGQWQTHTERKRAKQSRMHKSVFHNNYLRDKATVIERENQDTRVKSQEMKKFHLSDFTDFSDFRTQSVPLYP